MRTEVLFFTANRVNDTYLKAILDDVKVKSVSSTDSVCRAIRAENPAILIVDSGLSDSKFRTLAKLVLKTEQFDIPILVLTNDNEPRANAAVPTNVIGIVSKGQPILLRNAVYSCMETSTQT